MNTIINDRPWNEWSDSPPPRESSGCVDGEYVEDGRIKNAPIFCFHYGDERGPVWGHSAGSLRDGTWKAQHPTYHRWRYTGPRVPTRAQQRGTICVWRFHEAPGEIRALSRHGGDEDWVALLPDHDVPSWAEAGPFGSAATSFHELPDGRLVAIGAHA